MIPEKRKTIVYIDGYNWYHAIFKHKPEWKWLNVVALFEQILHREDVQAVKLFSAMVDGHLPASDARERQERYFRALETIPKAKIILGAFQERVVTCRGECGKPYVIFDEKKTDVNLAVEMIDDVVWGRCKHVCVVSGDSDVQPAVEWLKKFRPELAVTVYVPCLPSEQPTCRTDYYTTRKLDVQCRFLPLDRLRDFQMPKIVKGHPSGKLAIRPTPWSAPESEMKPN
jgi:6-hydroxy-3-succinoylpyridine 3-monooxygenase